MRSVPTIRRLSTSTLSRCLAWPACLPIQLDPIIDARSTGSCRRWASTLSLDALKEIRLRSGAPMVECKKALQHSNNDLTAAMDWLREHGAAKASSKVQGRATTEGLVGVATAENGRSASLVKVSSETDFASRSDKFQELVLNVANAALIADSASLSSESILNEVSASADGKSVKSLLDEAIVAIRENISVAHAFKLEDEGDNGGAVVGYVHNRVGQTQAGTAAALVHLVPLGEPVPLETMQNVGKKLAMHVVAARPQYLNSESIPSDVLAHEKEILVKQQEGSGKPPDIVAKVVEGRLRKFYESVCLTEQDHMIEEKNPKVGTFLEENGLAVKKFEALFVN